MNSAVKDSKSLLLIRDLHVSVEGKEILKGIDLDIKRGEIHAIMGPNGSGKSTLAMAIMGHPSYRIEKGEILLKGEDISRLPADERARLGLFLCFQYPVSVEGVSVANFMRSALSAVKGREFIEKMSIPRFKLYLKERIKEIGLNPELAKRYVNDGFSGGEKKRFEILQLQLLEPEIAILDEMDSGLDIDALKIASDGVMKYFNPERAILMITHYQRILNYVKPHFVHVLMDGKIVQSGGPELSQQLEEKGYQWVKENGGKDGKV